MENRIFSSGTGKENSLSNRPALLKAGSKFSGFELADITKISSPEYLNYLKHRDIIEAESPHVFPYLYWRFLFFQR